MYPETIINFMGEIMERAEAAVENETFPKLPSPFQVTNEEEWKVYSEKQEEGVNGMTPPEPSTAPIGGESTAEGGKTPAKNKKRSRTKSRAPKKARVGGLKQG